MILSDSSIIEMIRKGKLKIDNFNENNLTPNGYDVTVDECYIPSLNKKSEDIPGSTFFIISTKEYFYFPNDAIGQIWIRTSWARKGIVLSSGIIDAGFEGKLNLFAHTTNIDVKISKGDRIAQIIFIKLDREAEKPYSIRSGHYHKQDGIWLNEKVK